MAKNDPSLSESGLAPSNGAIEDVQPLSTEGAPEDTQLAEKWWTEVADEDSLRSHDRLRPWLEETETKLTEVGKVLDTITPVAEAGPRLVTSKL